MDVNLNDNTTISIGIIIALITAVGWIYSQVSKARKSVDDARLVQAVLMAELKTKLDSALTMLTAMTVSMKNNDEKIAELETRVAVLESRIQA